MKTTLITATATIYINNKDIRITKYEAYNEAMLWLNLFEEDIPFNTVSNDIEQEIEVLEKIAYDMLEGNNQLVNSVKSVEKELNETIALTPKQIESIQSIVINTLEQPYNGYSDEEITAFIKRNF